VGVTTEDPKTGPGAKAEAAPAAGEYCRQIEAYLCRENGGHLVRIVGPAFQTVVGWHAKGIPLGVVRQGIDRTLARDRAKPASGPRRPVRIEFCEADVLDAFAAWRRAIGAGMAGDRAEDEGAEAVGGEAAPAAVEPEPRPAHRTPSLVAHLDRAMRRLTQCVVDPAVPVAARTAIDRTLEALDALRTGSRGLRGEARAAVLAELARLDGELGARLLEAIPAAERDDLTRLARADLAPFAPRLAPADRAAAEAAATLRLLRERFRIPELVPSTTTGA
jgi:hypothetical protein